MTAVSEVAPASNHAGPGLCLLCLLCRVVLAVPVVLTGAEWCGSALSGAELDERRKGKMMEPNFPRFTIATQEAHPMFVLSTLYSFFISFKFSDPFANDSSCVVV